MSGLDIGSLKVGQYVQNKVNLYKIKEIRETGAFPTKSKDVVLENTIGKKCGSCHGTGRVPYERIVCDDCDGYGEKYSIRVIKPSECVKFEIVVPLVDELPVAA